MDETGKREEKTVEVCVLFYEWCRKYKYQERENVDPNKLKIVSIFIYNKLYCKYQ